MDDYKQMLKRRSRGLSRRDESDSDRRALRNSLRRRSVTQLPERETRFMAIVFQRDFNLGGSDRHQTVFISSRLVLRRDRCRVAVLNKHNAWHIFRGHTRS